MKPKRPYLLRALYDWIVDNDLTPYVLVEVDAHDVVVPQDFVEDGRIVLNVSPMAVRALSMEDDTLAFSGRFSGQPFNVSVPMRSVAAIYAKETGDGMMFDPEYSNKPAPAADVGGHNRAEERGGHLKVIK